MKWVSSLKWENFDCIIQVFQIIFLFLKKFLFNSSGVSYPTIVNQSDVGLSNGRYKDVSLTVTLWLTITNNLYICFPFFSKFHIVLPQVFLSWYLKHTEKIHGRIFSQFLTGLLPKVSSVSIQLFPASLRPLPSPSS